METTIPRPEEQEKPQEPDEDRQLRRVLLLLLGLLAVAAVALIIILLLVSNKKTPKVLGGTTPGYPIKVVRSIYGYGKGAGEQFKQPLGTALDPNGRLWVSDTGNSRVLIMSTSGKLIKNLGHTGTGAVSSPYGIAADTARKHMFVADWTARSVLEFTLDGKFVKRYPSSTQDTSVFGSTGFTPYDVRVAGSRVIAASNDGLYFFDRNGNVVARWAGAARGKAADEFNFPDSFDVDTTSGHVYVADTLNRRVVALDKDGKVLWVSGKPDDPTGKIVSFWQLPRSIVLGPDGNLYVTDTFRFDEKGVGKGQIVVLSKDGKLISEFGRSGTEEDSFNFPEKLAVGKNGLWAIADRENGRILLFKLDPIPAPDPAEVKAYSAGFLSAPKVSMARPVTSNAPASSSPTTKAP